MISFLKEKNIQTYLIQCEKVITHPCKSSYFSGFGTSANHGESQYPQRKNNLEQWSLIS